MARGEEGEQECWEVVWPEGRRGGTGVQGGDVARGEEGEQECREVMWPEGRRGSRGAGR